MIYSSIYKRNNFALIVKIFILKQVQVMFTNLSSYKNEFTYNFRKYKLKAEYNFILLYDLNNIEWSYYYENLYKLSKSRKRW